MNNLFYIFSYSQLPFVRNILSSKIFTLHPPQHILDKLVPPEDHSPINPLLWIFQILTESFFHKLLVLQGPIPSISRYHAPNSILMNNLFLLSHYVKPIAAIKILFRLFHQACPHWIK